MIVAIATGVVVIDSDEPAIIVCHGEHYLLLNSFLNCASLNCNIAKATKANFILIRPTF